MTLYDTRRGCSQQRNFYKRCYKAGTSNRKPWAPFILARREGLYTQLNWDTLMRYREIQIDRVGRQGER